MKLPDGSQVHMVGVCGVGMAGVARLLSARGHVVSGCDSQLNDLSKALENAGVKIQQGHSTSHIEDLPENSVLVVTPAVSQDEPELVAARRNGVPVVRRGEILASLVSQSTGIAICGTHGKTTTACFATRLLQELGADPGWCIGGFTASLGGVAHPGNNDLLVVEADESDGTLRYYHPAVTVVNNIDIDHLEHFDGEDDLLDCFRDVIRQTRKAVCVCADDERALRVVRDAGVDTLDYGFNSGAMLRAVQVETDAVSSSFDIVYKEIYAGRVTIHVGGTHNVINALGAVAAALASGYCIDAILSVLPKACCELPGRRFEELGTKNGVRYIADYAHHPVELKAAVQMALACRPGRVLAVFQPHRYTRTFAMGADFPAAFEGVSEVILLPVYAASEPVLEGGDICDLYAHFRKAPGGAKVTLCRSLDECSCYLKRIVVSNDLVLIAGAGDVINLRSMVDEDERPIDFVSFAGVLNDYSHIEGCANGALQSFSVFPTRGHATLVVNAAGKQAAANAVVFCVEHGIEWIAAGAGFNTFYGDCGLDACVIHVERLISGEPDVDSCTGEIIRAPCETSGLALLDKLKAMGLSGLEFMSGIPGTVGGWLAMNAGAHGGCISDCVESVELVNAEGEIIEIPAEECGFSYRRCDALKDGLALSCRLRLKKSTPENIALRMEEFRNKRIPLAGLRTAGSVFRNPPDDYAGRLLDEAGCRGLRIGGAYVADFHANVIVADDNCSASDILALIMMMRNRVKFRFGIDLNCEIRGVEL